MNKLNLHKFHLPQNPIFIVGYPRSGTTLLQRLLVTQQGLYSFPETHYFSIIEKHLQSDDQDNIVPPCLDTVYQLIYEKMKFELTKKEKDSFFKAAKNKKLTSKYIFEYITARFLLLQYSGINQKTPWRWIEKTPTHANFLDSILGMYPSAQVIHVLRHPVPAIFSRKFKLPFDKEKPVTKLAHAWNRLEENMQKSKQKYTSSIHTTRYEDLIQQMEAELKIIAGFLNIRFDPSLIVKLSQDKVNDPLILPFETWKQIDKNQTIKNTNTSYKYRIDQKDVDAIEGIVGQKMNKHGYYSYFNNE
jgi:hypothetical protein